MRAQTIAFRFIFARPENEPKYEAIREFKWELPWLPQPGNLLAEFFWEHNMSIECLVESVSFHRRKVTITIGPGDEEGNFFGRENGCAIFIRTFMQYDWALYSYGEEVADKERAIIDILGEHLTTYKPPEDEDEYDNEAADASAIAAFQAAGYDMLGNFTPRK